MLKTTPIVWAKDEEGYRHLCPYDALTDPNFVKSEEMDKCLHDDRALKSRRTVPSNDREGRLKFPKSLSLN